MPPYVLAALLAAAFLTGPTAFVLLALAHRKTRDASFRTLSFAAAGLCLVLAGNTASVLLCGFLGLGDDRLQYILMNGVFLATLLVGANVARFAHEATGLAVGPPQRGLFWGSAVFFFFAVLSLPLFLGPGRALDAGSGYLASTIYGSLCLCYASVIVVRRRDRLAPGLRRLLPPLFSVLPILSLLSVANDVFGFGRLLGGTNFPFSPFFFILVNIVVSIHCVRLLLPPGPVLPAGEAVAPSPPPTFSLPGLSERESELLPLILEGLSNEEIAERLFISPHTVKNHVTAIFRKAGVQSRFDLLKRLPGTRSFSS